MATKARRAAVRAQGHRSGFKRETDLTRVAAIREEARSVLIITNGENTEVDYFSAMKEEPWINAAKVIVKFYPGEPLAAVRRAATLRDENDYDEAWAVCDVDEYNPVSAMAAAHERQIELAWSVPCFEVWLILHLSNKCPGFNDCQQSSRYLKKFLPDWDKTVLKFSDFRSGVFEAVSRAKFLGDPPEANPSTAIWRLIESLNRAPEDGNAAVSQFDVRSQEATGGAEQKTA